MKRIHEIYFFCWILSVSVSEFDIIVLAMIAVTATTVAGFVSAYFLGKGSNGTDFGEEVLTNSTIENEEKKSIASWFYFDFENGNIALILILASGILLFILSYYWILSVFCGCRRCKGGRENFYREHFYAHRHQFNNANGNGNGT